jgi:metal-sulfur cluster biosynthetic enzyme
MTPTTDSVREVLRQVIDPELGLNVVDLGLIYNIDVSDEDKKISVDMTLTAPGCPLAGTIAAEVEMAIRQAFEGYDVEVNIVWYPPWSPEMMSEEARRHFGIA